MTLTSQLHKCDQFGAKINLNYGGEASYKTVGGGAASLILRVLILTYFTMQLIAVVQHKDPQINTYEILEDRS